jgi:hypothetical protein
MIKMITIPASGSLIGLPLRPPLANQGSVLCSTSPSNSLSKGEGAVLHILNQLYHYHINFISLLCIFGMADGYRYLRKARAVLGWPSPLEKVGMRLFTIHHSQS